VSSSPCCPATTSTLFPYTTLFRSTVPNYITQGGGAEVFKMKILECAQAGLDEYMILPVHDELILDVPGGKVKEVARTLHDIMNDTEMFPVPITASVSIGKRWGQKEDYVFS